MLTKVNLHRVLSAGAAAVIAGAAVQTIATAPARAQIACPTGYVCLQENATGGRFFRIAEGQHVTFPRGEAVGATANSTRLDYCFTSSPYNYVLRPGQETVRQHTVYSVTPGANCLT